MEGCSGKGRAVIARGWGGEGEGGWRGVGGVEIVVEVKRAIGCAVGLDCVCVGKKRKARKSGGTGGGGGERGGSL